MTRPPQSGVNEQRPGDSRSPAAKGESHPAVSAQAADVERAQQRLAQEANRAAKLPQSPDQARQLVQEIKHQISADPRGALHATGLASETLFEAATARPAS